MSGEDKESPFAEGKVAVDPGHMLKQNLHYFRSNGPRTCIKTGIAHPVLCSASEEAAL